MKKRQKLLSDEQWELIGPLFPEPRRRKDNRGRPWAENRACLESILWLLQTGAAWRFLPGRVPSILIAEHTGRQIQFFETTWSVVSHSLGMNTALECRAYYGILSGDVKVSLFEANFIKVCFVLIGKFLHGFVSDLREQSSE